MIADHPRTLAMEIRPVKHSQFNPTNADWSHDQHLGNQQPLDSCGTAFTTTDEVLADIDLTGK
ncbi:hypothetical protein [Streptomyces sp900116325]|uniref:hypothetical protein n=1 Tax=Streptomyces sp. 900116325 TaxID=3154295 RepID=UPI0033AB963B